MFDSILFPYTTLFRSISFFDQQKGVIGAEFVEANQLTDKSHGSSITLVNKEGQLIESGLEARHELEDGVAIYDYKGIVESKEGRSEEHTSELQSRFDL